MASTPNAEALLKRLFVMYIAALAVLFSCVAVSLVMTGRVTQQIAFDAREINDSGRQRMLSQRIIYLAQDLTLTDAAQASAIQSELLETIGELEAAIAQFEASHERLSTGGRLDAERIALYFSSAGDGPSLDERIKDYLLNARNIAAGRDAGQSFERLKDIERGGLLADLDAVVTATEAASLRRLDGMRELGRYSLIIAILIVLAEVALVFMPGHRMIRTALESLRTVNEKLRSAHDALQSKTRSLLERNERIEADRQRLHDAWQESETLRREQSEFTYAVSHDLKSPANTMHLLINELTLEHVAEFNEDGKHLLEMALQTVRRMDLQIHDLLQYCWATDPKSKPQDIDMNDCVQEVLAEMSDLIEEAHATINCKTLPSLFGHRIQIKVLLTNLIQNALKFQPEDAIPEVHIAAEPVGDHGGIKLSVRDNGIGIAPKNHARIFGLFQRLHVRETYPGTGLGLTTCHRIARNHHGDIFVESKEGQGSRFVVTLQPASGSLGTTPHYCEQKDAA